jgi:hypothetical protein
MIVRRIQYILNELSSFNITHYISIRKWVLPLNKDSNSTSLLLLSSSPHLFLSSS